MRRFLRKDKGNALIMAALSFAVLATFGVLTIDIGRILLTRNQLQNGADAAALAGAAVFCDNPATATDDGAVAQAKLVGGANNALGLKGPEAISDMSVTVTHPNNGATNLVEVETRSNTAQYFLRLLQGVAITPPAGTPRAVGATSDLVHARAAAACGATCGVSCVKPWSPPDRWDDQTKIPGYDGTIKALGNWANDGKYEQEDFTDVNGNGVYDQGEPFVDLNANGKHDAEFYSPTLTGYVPDPYPGNTLAPNGDLGLQITLEYANGNATTPVASNYQPVDLPPINRGNPISGANAFRDNIANCNQAEIFPGDWLATEPGAMVGPTNQGMRDLIAQDPNAYWDPITQSVQGSAFPISPRIVLIPMYDPRTFPRSGRTAVQVVKVAAFFMEQMQGTSQVRGRFLKVRAPGEPCVAIGGGNGGSGISFTYNLSLVR